MSKVVAGLQTTVCSSYVVDTLQLSSRTKGGPLKSLIRRWLLDWGVFRYRGRIMVPSTVPVEGQM